MDTPKTGADRGDGTQPMRREEDVATTREEDTSTTREEDMNQDRKRGEDRTEGSGTEYSS